MKVSIARTLNNGRLRFKPSWKPPGGKRRRQFFRTKAEAEAEKSEIERQHRTSGEVWPALAPADRTQLALLIREAIDGGFTLREAVDFRHCRALVSKSVADEFWKLTPDVCKA